MGSSGAGIYRNNEKPPSILNALITYAFPLVHGSLLVLSLPPLIPSTPSLTKWLLLSSCLLILIAAVVMPSEAWLTTTVVAFLIRPRPTWPALPMISSIWFSLSTSLWWIRRLYRVLAPWNKWGREGGHEKEEWEGEYGTWERERTREIERGGGYVKKRFKGVSLEYRVVQARGQ